MHNLNEFIITQTNIYGDNMIEIYGELPNVHGSIPKDPPFSKYKPDFKTIDSVAKRFKRFKNVIVIGNGGSINSFRAITTLTSKKKIFFVDTMEPEVLEKISKSCDQKDTVVIPVSKSGNTIGVLEELLYFINKGYKNVISVTGGGSLKDISEKMNWNIVNHPNIGGRFAGLTSCALLPSNVCGFDVKKIYSGAKKIYGSAKTKKKIYKLAKSLFELEKNGYNEIFMPVYSELLGGFIPIITQLVHETTGKNELGQTIIATIAPESQHHTNQRFFGGPRDMIGFFITVKNHGHVPIRVPTLIRNVKIKHENLSILNGINLSDAIKYEFKGVLETVKEKKIPYIVLEIDRINEGTVGELLAFWQMLAYYSAVIRGQNPFDQPEVERSKEITFNLIKNLNKRNKDN